MDSRLRGVSPVRPEGLSPSLESALGVPSFAFSRIRVVLSHTSHPGNIGAAARAYQRTTIDVSLPLAAARKTYHEELGDTEARRKKLSYLASKNSKSSKCGESRILNRILSSRSLNSVVNKILTTEHTESRRKQHEGGKIEEPKRAMAQHRCLSNSFSSPSLRVSVRSVVNSSINWLRPTAALRPSW